MISWDGSVLFFFFFAEKEDEEDQSEIFKWLNKFDASSDFVLLRKLSEYCISLFAFPCLYPIHFFSSFPLWMFSTLAYLILSFILFCLEFICVVYYHPSIDVCREAYKTYGTLLIGEKVYSVTVASFLCYFLMNE